MNKFNLLIFGTSVALSCLISTLFGLAGQTIVGTFWGWFWISLLILFIGFAIVNSFLIQRDSVAIQRAELETLDKLSKFTIKLSCAYCQQPSILPIQLNQRNTFKCESCNQVHLSQRWCHCWRNGAHTGRDLFRRRAELARHV